MLKITKNVYQQIMNTIGQLPPECGGVLGAGEDGMISEYYFDKTGQSTPSGYTPNVCAINKMLTNDWMPRGILMVGIVHSHANGIAVPSCNDIYYGMRILQALDTVKEFYLPIVAINGTHQRFASFVITADPQTKYTCNYTNTHII